MPRQRQYAHRGIGALAYAAAFAFPFQLCFGAEPYRAAAMPAGGMNNAATAGTMAANISGATLWAR